MLFNPYKIHKPIRLIELFGGIGAQAKALENLGVKFEHYKYCDFDKYAVCAYNAIHDTNFEPSDITKVKGEDLEIIDKEKYEYIMTYSFPCQDLSLVGKRKGMKENSNTKSSLLWEVKRILLELKEINALPQILLMENVPQVVGDKNKKEFNDWYNFLIKIGYENYGDILNSKDYGIPQNRKRFFLVSFNNNSYFYYFPSKQKLKSFAYENLEKKEDEKYYLSDKLIKCFLDEKNRNGYIRKDKFKPKEIKNFKIANTITTLSGNRPTDNFIKIENKIRKLTPKECWRLMGFSDIDFENAKEALNNTFHKGRDKSQSQLYKQAGNSIVVDVLMNIFKEFI